MLILKGMPTEHFKNGLIYTNNCYTSKIKNNETRLNNFTTDTFHSKSIVQV